MTDIKKCDYDIIAENYDNVRGSEADYVMYWTTQLAEHAELKETDTVLDIGCGTGRYTETFASSGTRKVVGLDSSRQMISRASEKYVRRNLFWVQGKCEFMPFKQNIFKVAFMALVVHHIPDSDRLRAYGQVLEVLRPKGRFVIITRAPEQILDSLISLFPGVAEIDTVRMPDIKALKSDLIKAGFSKVQIHAVPQYTMHRNRDEFLRKVESKYISTLTMFTDEEFNKRVETFKNRLDERFGDASELYDPMEFTIVVAEK